MSVARKKTESPESPESHNRELTLVDSAYPPFPDEKPENWLTSLSEVGICVGIVLPLVVLFFLYSAFNTF